MSGHNKAQMYKGIQSQNIFFPAAFKLGRHKIGNTSSQKWVLRSIELTQQKETFYIYELNNHQRHFSLNMDEFQSSHANWKCDED